MIGNIEDIKNLVENTKDSYRSIAEKFNTNHTQIKNLIKKHGWNVEHRPKRNVSKISKSVEIAF